MLAPGTRKFLLREMVRGLWGFSHGLCKMSMTWVMLLAWTWLLLGLAWEWEGVVKYPPPWSRYFGVRLLKPRSVEVKVRELGVLSFISCFLHVHTTGTSLCVSIRERGRAWVQIYSYSLVSLKTRVKMTKIDVKVFKFTSHFLSKKD